MESSAKKIIQSDLLVVDSDIISSDTQQLFRDKRILYQLVHPLL